MPPTLPETVAPEAPVALVAVGERAAYVRGGQAVVGTRAEVIARAANLEALEHPRWTVVSAQDALADLVSSGVHIARCWDLAEVHRLLFGRWRAEPAYAWACAQGLRLDALPAAGGGDLFDFAAAAPTDEDTDSPVGVGGYLRPDAFTPGWADRDTRLEALAGWVLDLAELQRQALAAIGARAVTTAHSESAAAVLCLELERDGLPVDRASAERIIAASAGPRPTSEAHASQIRRERDARVLAHVRARSVDLRNPAQVKELLEEVGVHVPTTRAWVLEPYRQTHPVVDALLTWRKEERIATTYGYRWLDEAVGADGRLRGRWTACDGAAGRMTAQNGLHNLPAPLRPAVAATPGHVFVRADLGQIEPRLLAAISGDVAFGQHTRSEDLYAPVAAKLGIERAQAKVAVLAAMYGQRSGSAGRALADLERAYPVAMGLLDRAYAAGVARRPLRTFGGRLIALDAVLTPPSQDGGPALDAARGRFARNAVVQGAAAELFKAWAATVRHGLQESGTGARIVLALHDELLVQVPEEYADEAVRIVRTSLIDGARRWTGSEEVRFVADVSVIRRWDEAKG
jgi:DNA polymerase-1